MRRGVYAGWLLLLTLLVAPATAQAASDLSLHRAADGTWIVVGSGWHPAEQVLVTAGQARFVALTDGAGDFEVATGLSSYPGPVSVHHQLVSDMPMLALAPPAPHPLALALVQGLAEGAALLGAGLGLLLLGLGIRRLQRAWLAAGPAPNRPGPPHRR